MKNECTARTECGVTLIQTARVIDISVSVSMQRTPAILKMYRLRHKNSLDGENKWGK